MVRAVIFALILVAVAGCSDEPTERTTAEDADAGEPQPVCGWIATVNHTLIWSECQDVRGNPDNPYCVDSGTGTQCRTPDYCREHAVYPFSCVVND